MSSPPLKSILYVEDEPDIQTIARLALQSVGGFEVFLCSSGGEALKVAPTMKPDLILLDVMMPEMDGMATLGALKRLEGSRDTPIIFMTAKVQTQEVQQYLDLGAIGVIPKPFNPMSLSQTVRNIWQAHHEP